MVKLSQPYETEWTFELEYVLPEDQAFIENPPAEVTAAIAGSGWKLMHFSLFRVGRPLVFDLRALPLSILERRLLIDRIQDSFGEPSLTVKTINLDFIAIRTGPVDRKRLPVRLAYEISLQAQHDFKEPLRLDPDSVWVTGPDAILDTLTFWSTDTGRIGPLKSSITQTISLAPALQGGVRLDTDRTTLYLSVEPVVEKTVYFVPVTVSNAPGKIRIFPPSVTVYCTVGMSAYDQLTAENFSIEADLRGVLPKSQQNTAPLSLTRAPDYVKSVRFSPQSVEFFIQMEGEE